MSLALLTFALGATQLSASESRSACTIGSTDGCASSQVRSLLQARVQASQLLERNPLDPKDYADAYNNLYDNYGYHNDLQLSHETLVVKVAQEEVPEDKRTSITFGCSHGLGVEMLHKLGFKAFGVDVASKAIDMAITRRGDTCGQPPCFKIASLTDLPYGNRSFDVGLSSDVLEHISPDDMPKVAAEMSRVVRIYLILRIANFPEMSKSGEHAGMFSNVHLSVHESTWWVNAFKPFGWKLNRDLSDPDGKQHGPGNYVFIVLTRQP